MGAYVNIGADTARLKSDALIQIVSAFFYTTSGLTRMLTFQRSQLRLPLIHLLIFALTWIFFWIQPQPLLDGPSRWPFIIIFLADLPLSAIAFGVMFSSDARMLYAVVTWGVLGTLWWYFLGGLIAQRRRLK